MNGRTRPVAIAASAKVVNAVPCVYSDGDPGSPCSR